MPIGKDSITKRVAKTTAEEKNIAPELIATVGVAPAKKAPPKKPSSTAKKTTSAAKKTAIKVEKVTPPTVKPDNDNKVETAVLANVSPETVKAVIGHTENEKYEKVQIGQKMPVHLL